MIASRYSYGAGGSLDEAEIRPVQAGAGVHPNLSEAPENCCTGLLERSDGGASLHVDQALQRGGANEKLRLVGKRWANYCGKGS